jgi:hypothetical protein
MSTTPTGIEAEVCQDIATRQAKGIAKYGTTVLDNPLSLRQWVQHAYEECLDQAVYLRRIIHEIDREKTPKILPNDESKPTISTVACFGTLKHFDIPLHEACADCPIPKACLISSGLVANPNEPFQPPKWFRKPNTVRSLLDPTLFKGKVSVWDEINARANAANGVPLSANPKS